MEAFLNILQYMRDHPEVTWSGAGLTGLGLLYFLITRLHAALFRRDRTPPSADNTFNCTGCEQNVAQGDGAVAQQNNYNGNSATNTGSGAVVQDGGAAAGAGGVAVEGNVGGDVIINNYPRTPQGIPLQRPPQVQHLLGRETLLKELLAALRPGRMVTLCGPGGIGKTALASRAAWELAPAQDSPALFPDGLIFYSFYGRRDVGLAFDHLVRSY